jgi:pyruvate/2-oxoglutarate dehydrogenase complex dihydrolipoamide dehydrogenase (E3) component
MTDTTESTYDVVVIGAGAVGENIADRAVQGGLTVVIVENELVGGACSYWACMPSKTLLRSGAAIKAAQRVPGAAEAVTGKIDPRAVLMRRNVITHDWNDDSQVKWLHRARIDLVRGHARLTGVKEVTVTSNDGQDTTVLTANHAVAIATGSTSMLPDVPGLDTVEAWDSHKATAAQDVPESLAIIGGGVTAVEMADAYSSLGSKVTLVARSTLIRSQEPFAGEMVAEALEAAGVRILIDTRLEAAERNGDGDVLLRLSNGETITTSKVIVATGMVPNTSDIGIELFGLKSGDWLNVDDTLLVQGDSPELQGQWLYAAGDVNKRALFTHQGKYQARAAGDVIAARANGWPVDDAPWGSHVATADHTAVPSIIFTDPTVASVGLTSAEAERAEYTFRVVDYDMSWLAGASVLADDYVGKARAVIDEDRGVILGVTFVGQDVAELLHSATIAVVGEVPLSKLWHAVPGYPTLSEIWLRLLEAYGRPNTSATAHD